MKIINLVFSFCCFISVLMSQSPVSEKDYRELTVQFKGEKNPQTINVIVENGRVIFGGDMYIGLESVLFSDKKGNVTPYLGDRWPGGVVYYESNFAHAQKEKILSAMNHISSNTNICFAERDNGQYGIVFEQVAGVAGGSSYVGYVGQDVLNSLDQPVKLGELATEETAIHELLHVVGLHHEHGRPDRDDYIIFNDDIPEICKVQYEQYGTDFSDYDFHSIMHYSANQCSSEPAFTLKPNYQEFENIVGNATSMSAGDIAAVSSLYPGPCIGFVCRGCTTDLTPVCSSLDVTASSNSIMINQLAIENLQSAEAINFSVGYYLSTTNDLSNGTPIGFQTIGIIYGNSTYYIDPISFSIPSSILSNNYYVIAVVDLPNHTGDIDVNNNVCFGYGPIYVGGAVSCNDGIQNQGEFGVDCGGPCPACSPQVNLVSQTCAVPLVNNNQLDILYDITNFGSSASGVFNVSFFAYKRHQSNYTALNIDTQHSIPGNTSKNFKKVLDLSTLMTSVGLGAGDYKIGMYIDDYQVINETNEDDNWCVLDNYFTYITHNLTHSESCLNSFVNGEYLNVVLDVVNEGTTSTGIVNYQCYISDLSNGNTYPIGDTYGIVNIPANTTHTEHILFHLETEMAAHGLSQGEYSVGIFIDNSGIIEESNENDNFCLGSSSFTYTGGCSMSDGYINGTYSSIQEFSAPNYIKSPNVGDECRISSGGQVVMQAGGHVDLLPGFVADFGSRFTAAIDDCGNNNLLEDIVELRDDVQLTNAPKEDKGSIEDTNLTLKGLTIVPNPFATKTTISYDLVESEIVTVYVSDINGRMIQVLVDEAYQTSGRHKIDYNNESLVNGTYLITMKSSVGMTSRKMVVLK